MIRRCQDTQSQLSDGFIQVGGEDTIAIVDEVLVAMDRRDPFAKLLLCPRSPLGDP